MMIVSFLQFYFGLLKSPIIILKIKILNVVVRFLYKVYLFSINVVHNAGNRFLMN